MKNIVDSYSRNFIDVVCRGEWRVALPLVCPADLMCRTRSDGRHGHGCARHDRAPRVLVRRPTRESKT